MSHIGYDYDKQIIPNHERRGRGGGRRFAHPARAGWHGGLRRRLAGRRLPHRSQEQGWQARLPGAGLGILAGGGRAEGQLRRQWRRDGLRRHAARADGQRLQDRRRGGLPGGPGRHRGRHQGQRLPVSAGAGRRRAGRTAALQGQGRHVQRQPGGEGAAGTVLAPRAGRARLARLQPVRRGLQHAGQRQPARRRHPAAGSPGLPGSGQRQLRRRRHLAAKRRRRARAAQGHRHGGQCDRGGALRQHAVAPERDRRRGQEHAGRRHAGGLRRADRPVHTRTRAACASTSTPRSRKAAGYPTSRSTTPPRPHGVRWTPAARTSSSC